MSITAISILAIAYLVLGILAFNPRVDDDYRAYYIEKTTSYWKPPRYSARVTDGIDFSKPGIPNFVASIFGVSYNESRAAGLTLIFFIPQESCTKNHLLEKLVYLLMRPRHQSS